MPNNPTLPPLPSVSPLRRSASTPSLHSDLSCSSCDTARSRLGPPPFSRGAGPASSGSASPGDARRSAASRPAAAHTTIDLTASSASSPGERVEVVRRVRERIDSQVALLVRCLHDDAAAGAVRVPPEFVAPHGEDRQAAYAAHCGDALSAFAARISEHIVDEGFTDESLMKAFDAVTRKDDIRSTVIGALERLPLIASLALMNCMRPFAEAASKADPSAKWRSGLVTGGLTNASAALLQQAFGPYVRAVASGPDPYITRPPTTRLDPALVQALKALSPVTLGQRFAAARDGAVGIVAGTVVGGIASTAMTASGVAAVKAVPAAIAARAAGQFLATGPASAAANRRLDSRQFLQGLLPWVARQDFAATAHHAHDRWLTADNARQVLKTGARLMAAPVTGLVPRRLMPAFMAPPPAASERVPPVLQNLDHPVRLIGPAAFGLVGAAVGAHDGLLSHELAQVTRSDRVQATLNAGLRSVAAIGGVVTTASGYALGNAMAAETLARRARAAGIATPAEPTVATDVPAVMTDAPTVSLDAAAYPGAGRSSSYVHPKTRPVRERSHSV